MKSARIFSIIATLSILEILVFSNAYGTGEWTILRNDDFVRKDGVEGDLRAVHCVDAKHAWAVGFGGLILQTTDGGKTWTKKEIEMDSSLNLWNVYFRSTNLGFITGVQRAMRGVRAVIFMTTDGGDTWARKDLEVRSQFAGMWMIDDLVGFMVGGDKAFFKTTDGGETWTGSAERVRLGETRHDLWDIFFASPVHGWMVGSYGHIQHTQDGGQTWTDQHLNVDNTLMAVHFVDERTGWIAGQEGLILHTRDGGATWTQQNTDSYDTLHDIVFMDKQTGWAVGDFGTLLYTSDGGQTWAREKTGASTTLRAIDGVNKHCLAVGDWGLILGYGQ